MRIKLLSYILLPTILFVLYKFLKQSKKLKPSIRDAVLITGCDSGIGFTMACHCQKIGMTVLAGCYDSQSRGALYLQSLENTHSLQLDVTDANSIRSAVVVIDEILKNSNVGKRISIITILKMIQFRLGKINSLFVFSSKNVN